MDIHSAPGITIESRLVGIVYQGAHQQNNVPRSRHGSRSTATGLVKGVAVANAVECSWRGLVQTALRRTGCSTILRWGVSCARNAKTWHHIRKRNRVRRQLPGLNAQRQPLGQLFTNTSFRRPSIMDRDDEDNDDMLSALRSPRRNARSAMKERRMLLSRITRHLQVS